MQKVTIYKKRKCPDNYEFFICIPITVSLSPSLFLVLLMDCIVPEIKSATIFEDWCL